jgi:hypothetical protein
MDIHLSFHFHLDGKTITLIPLSTGIQTGLFVSILLLSKQALKFYLDFY